MKAYMGYDRVGGSGEGACLIFASNAKVARKRAWWTLRSWFDTEWIDVAAKLLRDLPEHLKVLDNGTEQVIESPKCCSRCERWGGRLFEDSCSMCVEEGQP